MRIFKSFSHAIRGIIYCIKNERNMRFHSVVSVYVIILSYIFELSFEKLAVILLTISAVLVSEMVNTAIEELSDIWADDYNMCIKIVKDLSAGAVMISAFFSVLIGIIMFHDIQYYVKIFNFLRCYPLAVVGIIFLIIVSYLYVEWGPNKIKEKLKKVKLWFKKI